AVGGQLVHGVVQPGMPFRRHFRGLRRAVIEHPAALAAVAATAGTELTARLLPIVTGAVRIGADELALPPREEPRSNGHAVQRISVRAGSQEEAARRVDTASGASATQPKVGATMAPQEPSRPAPAGAPVIGLALVALSATCYGLVPIFARFAYAAGATPLTLLSLRYVVATLALWAALLARRRPLLLPADRRFAGVATGVFLAIIAWSFLAAIRMIPVSLAALLFLTYPLLVTTIGWLRGEHV